MAAKTPWREQGWTLQRVQDGKCRQLCELAAVSVVGKDSSHLPTSAKGEMRSSHLPTGVWSLPNSAATPPKRISPIPLSCSPSLVCQPPAIITSFSPTIRDLYEDHNALGKINTTSNEWPTEENKEECLFYHEQNLRKMEISVPKSFSNPNWKFFRHHFMILTKHESHDRIHSHTIATQN